MVKINISIILSTLLATFLGIFNENFAYYLKEHFIDLWPVTYVMISTIASVILFIVSLLLIFVLYKKYKLSSDKTLLYTFIVGGIGLMTSSWSIFVLAMWMG